MVEEHKNYIDGQWVESESGRTFEVHNPARLSEVTGRFPLSSEQDVDRAIRAAKKGFSTWTEFSPQKRAGILKDARQLMKERREEIAQILTRENGKTLEEARGEIDYALSDMEFQIAEGMRMAGETMPVTMSGVNAYSIRVAVGIVGVITPWNFPFNVPTAKCVPALASGCAVIFKPASQTSHTGIKLVELFEDAGVPEGVINCVLGSGREVGNAIASDPRMDAITFTGSTEVGRTINALAAENLVRTQLEMGGKNGVIVLKDADIEAAVSDTISAAFGTSGQKCTATSRAIVVDEIADEFVEKLLEGVHSIRVGEGTEENVDIGPVTGKDQLEKILSYIELGQEEGARLLTGGQRLTGPDYDDGCFVAPTVFDEVTPEMRIAREEIFGPVLSIERVRDFEQALGVHNDTPYGLSGSLYTRNLEQAQKFVQRADVGVTHVNLMTALNEPQLSFGGMKDSGYGIPEAGRTGMDFYTEQKVAYVKYK